MSINLRYAINPETTKHLGPLFHTIDFEGNRDFTGQMVKDGNERLNCGVFCINGREYKMTMPEVQKMERKLTEVVQKFYSRADPINEYELIIENRTYSLTKRETEYTLQTFTSVLRNLQKKIKLGI